MYKLYFVFYCIFFLDFTYNTVHTLPAEEFSKHSLINTKVYYGREKRQILSTKDNKIVRNYITIHYTLNNKPYILDLKRNKNLLPKGYFQKYQKDGKNVIENPSLRDIDHCHYNGKVRGVSNSWVTVSYCKNSLKGVVFDGKEMHHIEKNYNETVNRNNLHYLYKHSNLIKDKNKTSGHEGRNIIEEEYKNVRNRLKRSSEIDQIRGPYNANQQSRYIELVLVVDNRQYNHLGRDLRTVYQFCKDIANILNGLYLSLNIFIALVGVVVWTERDEIELSPNSNRTLDNFLHYRLMTLLTDHPNDHAQLLTRYQFDVLGRAYHSEMCSSRKSGGLSKVHSEVNSLVAITIAHEMGHNLGLDYDTDDCKCSQKQCIMHQNYSLSTTWSSCSHEHLAIIFKQGMDYCLRNKPVSLFDSPTCGNGFVEPGEQCDCGLPENCNNTCCNAAICMLYNHASCATGECCDLKTCRSKNAGSLCRAADNECDLAEYCTGQSEYCPADVYKIDTEICNDGKDYCYHGTCRTHSEQCKLLWGSTGRSSNEVCYKKNTEGSAKGNCGYHHVNNSFIKCEFENILCGRLQCQHINEKLEFGKETSAILSHSFVLVNGSVFPCRNAIIDFESNIVDPGLVPDGASCGKRKMCLNQKCISVESLRGKKHECPQNCNGNGVCNNLGHCHCEVGFAPPFCDIPGLGGSIDSGTISDPNARKGFITILCIIFFVIILLIILVIIFIYYHKKRNTNFKWQSTASKYISRFNNNCRNGWIQLLSLCYYFNQRKPTISTISQNVDENTNKNINLDIKQTGLISTTNENLLNNSADNLLEIIPPIPKKRLSIKNLSRLKIDIKLAKQNSKNHIETPKTTETICDDDDFPAISVKKLTNQFQNSAGTSSNT